MRIPAFLAMLLSAFLAGYAPAAFAQGTPLDCPYGPIDRTFGGSLWSIASCVDDRTITLLAVANSAAHPAFIAMFPSADARMSYPTRGGYTTLPSPGGFTIDARGTGNPDAIQAAADALSRLSPSELAALVAETRRATPRSRQSAVPATKPLDCRTKPIVRTFGGSDWNVHACDEVALLVVPVEGNPAAPFYFLVTPSPTGQGYRVEGEGTGDKKATDAAYADLRLLSEADVTGLIREVKQRQ
ncbi:hypothetical protein [Reyranella sp.]|uniref:hypothetical protein n=1 Tax=Reyranella sp. TaxID=1929291 RepID=UPI003BAC54B3